MVDSAEDSSPNMEDSTKVASPHMEDSTRISSLSVKLPKFYKFNPTAWFQIAESHFRLAKITTQATKFDHVLVSLDPDVSTEIDDFLSDPPKEQQYDQLCEILKRRFTLSDAEKLKQLENLGPLGDMKPSQLLRQMQRLSNNQVGNNPLLEGMFFSRLPTYVKHIVKRADLTLTKKADLSDELMADEVSTNQYLTFAVTQHTD